MSGRTTPRMNQDFHCETIELLDPLSGQWPGKSCVENRRYQPRNSLRVPKRPAATMYTILSSERIARARLTRASLTIIMMQLGTVHLTIADVIMGPCGKHQRWSFRTPGSTTSLWSCSRRMILSVGAWCIGLLLGATRDKRRHSVAGELSQLRTELVKLSGYELGHRRSSGTIPESTTSCRAEVSSYALLSIHHNKIAPYYTLLL